MTTGRYVKPEPKRWLSAGGSECIPELVKILDDEYWQVCLKAVRTLGKLSAKQAANKIGELMSIPVPNLRKECAAALGELAMPSTAEFLKPFVDDNDPDVRKNVRWALDRIEAEA